MKTNEIIAAVAVLAATGCAHHPKPTVYEAGTAYADDEEDDAFDEFIADLEADVAVSVRHMLDERSTGFVAERVGQPEYSAFIGSLEWKTDRSLAGFDARACAVRELPEMFDDPVADVSLYICAARIGEGPSGDFDFDIVRTGVAAAVSGLDSWTSERNGPVTTFYERGSRMKTIGHGDIEVRRQPLGDDAEQVVVTIFAVSPPMPVGPGS